LENSVTFVGSVKDVSPYLQVADIFAFPTENDAFPSSLVEAMACGVPVVTTPVGAIGTIVRDGENGLMVRPGNAAELQAALERLLTDPESAAPLGEAARRTIVANFSAKSITRRYMDSFRQLVGIAADSICDPP
jgi:glycosyltransferase involved in cell wall biosynthesis